MTLIEMPARDDPTSTPAIAAPDPHGPEPHLAHHFDTPKQQFEAAKLGMWLFVATELLLFGGLFCAYAVFRGNHPELFAYGSQFLDTRWGALNTAVLIISSMTMALAVTAAQRGQYRPLVALLLVTFLGGATFMAVKLIEYNHKFHEHLFWNASFYEQPAWAVLPESDAGILPGDAGPLEVTLEGGDAELGVNVWTAVCRSCHGAGGEGVDGQGKDVRGSTFALERTDAEMVAFLSVGRLATDPLNTTGIQMPPKGGNPLLSDLDLLNAVAYLRTLTAPADGGAAASAGEADAETETAPAREIVTWIPRTVIPDPATAPTGLAPAVAALPVHPVPIRHPHHTIDPQRPANAHLFFALYFGMTGLHGVHVVAGMILIAWLTFGAVRRRYGPRYFTPIDLGGLYWHVVDLIWIFLFPLFYLI